MSKFNTICVYCGASDHIDDSYKNAAYELGKYLAESKRTLIYGGGKAGNMGKVANGALAHGGKVIGITPRHIEEIDPRHEDLTELYIVDTLHERKMMMAQKSDAFIILPGGLGTLDEFFEITTWKQLKLHNKPIIVVNINGYWDILQNIFTQIVDQKFGKAECLSYCTFVPNIQEAFRTLEQHELSHKPIKTLEKI